MAEHKVTANDIALMLSRDGGVTWPYVVCLTSFAVNRETNVIDAASFCGPDKLPGVQDNGVEFEGQMMEDPTGGTISTDDLIDMWTSKETVSWRVGKLSPSIGDETDFGTGFISQINKSGSTNEVVTFTGAISVYGLMGHTTATS